MSVRERNGVECVLSQNHQITNWHIAYYAETKGFFNLPNSSISWISIIVDQKLSLMKNLSQTEHTLETTDNCFVRSQGGGAGVGQTEPHACQKV